MVHRALSLSELYERLSKNPCLLYYPRTLEIHESSDSVDVALAGIHFDDCTAMNEPMSNSHIQSLENS